VEIRWRVSSSDDSVVEYVELGVCVVMVGRRSKKKWIDKGTVKEG
jgi:hypothetical protein